MSGTWRDRAPRSLIDPLDSQGQPVFTPADRRWLWRLEGFLAINGTNDLHRQLGRDLAQYLNETCEHHWHQCQARTAARRSVAYSALEGGTSDDPHRV